MRVDNRSDNDYLLSPKIPVSTTNLVINIPLIIAWKLLGSQTLYLSILGTFSVCSLAQNFEILLPQTPARLFLSQLWTAMSY